jgi:hypothetical protein
MRIREIIGESTDQQTVELERIHDEIHRLRTQATRMREIGRLNGGSDTLPDELDAQASRLERSIKRDKTAEKAQ